MPFDTTGARSGPSRRHACEDWTLSVWGRREALFRAADHDAAPGDDLLALLSPEALAPATTAPRTPRRSLRRALWQMVLGMIRPRFRAA